MSQVDGGERTTRKPHQCTYCALDIPSGTKAFWWTWTEGGRIETSYGHPDCQAAYGLYCREYGPAVDDHLPDQAEFRSELLPAYREQVVGAAGLVGAEPAGTPHETGEV